MTEALEVLHVASFVGNIGDNANHNGTRKLLASTINEELTYRNLEMRKFYQNYNKRDQRSFDDSFIAAANASDLVLFGGGSFFDLWLEDSATGTTIDLSNSQIDRIQTPIVFHGLGCIPGQAVSQNVEDRFRSFLGHVLGSDHCLVSVRNDGSVRHIQTYIGDSWAEDIHVIPDGGFFVDVCDYDHQELPDEDPVIGINVVSDMKTRRFPGGSELLDYDGFIDEYAEFADKLLNQVEGSRIIFIPHIYSDLEAINDIMAEMDVMFRRNRVTVAPYIHGMGKEKYIFDIYRKVNMSMGLRFHSNVCPIGLGTPSIGLANGHPKVADLYHELDLFGHTIAVDNPSFSGKLLTRTKEVLGNQVSIAAVYERKKVEMEKDIVSFHRKINRLIR